jgi:hypothetical protein
LSTTRASMAESGVSAEDIVKSLEGEDDGEGGGAER